MISESNLSPVFLLPWAAMWIIGGIWLARGAFKLRPNEELLVGVALGWLVQNWLANLLARVLPVPTAFWGASICLLIAGLFVFLRSGWKSLFQVTIRPVQMILFAGIVLVFYSIGRGLAIFDDFQHLAAISLMAAGDIPPHFALDPQVMFGYHHFLQLFAAQMTRIGGIAPWVSIDAARALSFGMAVMLGSLWTQRVTRSRIAGWLAGLVLAFGSGTRWLLLFFPSGLVELLGMNIQMIGSGQASGANLADALGNAWAVEGAGTIPFPFAFANGIFPAGVIQIFTANGFTFLAVVFLLLLTFNRAQDWVGPVLSAVLISTWGLLGEAELAALAAGCGLVAVGYSCVNRTFRLPVSLWSWLAVAAGGCVIGMLAGGAWTDLLLKALQRVSGQAAEVSYQTIGFQLAAPAVVSSHLGILSILQPGSLLVALFELGPVLVVFPLLFVWGLKAFRLRRWFEASLVAAAALSWLALFVQFSGSTGVRNTPRLYVFMPLVLAFSTALVWNWASRRPPRSRIFAITLGVVGIMGGIVIFGIELVAAQRSVYSYYITALDARMARAYWNRLAPDALVFDPVPYRAPALLGRPTNAYFTWYDPKPEWMALRASPNPADLKAYGFRYVYLDNHYWAEIGPPKQHLFDSACVQTLQEWDDQQGNFRRLLDIQNCQ